MEHYYYHSVNNENADLRTELIHYYDSWKAKCEFSFFRNKTLTVSRATFKITRRDMQLFDIPTSGDCFVVFNAWISDTKL